MRSKQATDYNRLENSCLYKGFYTRGDMYAIDPDDGVYYCIQRGVRIFTSIAHPNSGTWDAYPAPEGRARRDRLAKPVRVKRFEIDEWGYTNDWYIV